MFQIQRNILGNLDKYILLEWSGVNAFGKQERCQGNLEKYIQEFGQILFQIQRHTLGNLDKYILQEHNGVNAIGRRRRDARAEAKEAVSSSAPVVDL